MLPYAPQAQVVSLPVAVLANGLLAARNGPRLLAPATVLNDLANALGASPSKAFGTMLEPPPVERSGIWNMPPRKALQEKMGVSFETKDCLHFPLRALRYHLVWAQMTTKISRAVRIDQGFKGSIGQGIDWT